MNGHREGSKRERLGYRLGHAMRRLAHRATAVRRAMVKCGVHPLLATVLVRAVQVAFVAMLACLMLWLGLIVVLAIVLARLMENADLRAHSGSCPHCHCQCIWCNQPFWDNDI